jgi:hypothetical protein
MAQQTLSKPYWQVYLRIGFLWLGIMTCLFAEVQAQATQEETAAHLHRLIREIRLENLRLREQLKQARDSLITSRADNPQLIEAIEGLEKENERLQREVQELEERLDAFEGKGISKGGTTTIRDQDTDIRLWRPPAETLLLESMFLLDRLKRFLRLH